MNSDNWMRISLKSNWEIKIFDKAKMYFLDLRDRELVDQIFDELHRNEKLAWITQSTSFNYFLFCVWKNINDERKSRVVVDVRDLNVIIELDVYSLSLQSNIIQLVANCIYITMMNCAFFFYQWRVHSFDRHKFTVVSHREQKSFNVAMMSYKNSSTYVQRQIDRILRQHRNYARAYVDDIVIFFKSLKEHEEHLRRVFITLSQVNIFIKFAKVFIEYSIVNLLDQRVDSLDLATTKNKLKTISKLRFSRNLQQLEIYLDLTNWLREYISHYVDVAKSLQNKKTKMLRDDSVANHARRSYFSKIKIINSILRELAAFDTLQKLFSRSSYLIHASNKRQLFVDLDGSKKFDFETMIYHVKKSWTSIEYSSRNNIELILFLSRLATLSKTRY